MEPKIWCINLSGGSKYISISVVEKYKALGWVVIPPDKLDAYGKPKQTYWPNYDKNNPTRERRISVDEREYSKNILKVETF